MEVALYASLCLETPELLKGTTLEARKYLQDKVETAGHHVMAVVDLTIKRSEHCKALIGELKMLKDLMYPKKKENNKSLYEGIDAGDVGGDQDNGGSDDGQPDWGVESVLGDYIGAARV
jgi:hypothetical protein